MTSNVSLRARGLVKTFEKPVKSTILNGIDIEVRAGETVAIGGRSGEGKSTLLQILGTLDSPTAGYLEILGNGVSRMNRCVLRSRHIGFVFQAFYLLSDYSALDNVLMSARIARRPTGRDSEAYEQAVCLLEHVGLKDRMHHSTKLLSGGEKQRVAIARALCNNPSILFADEPTGNLDRQTAEGIYKLLFETASAGNKSLIVVTHDPMLMNMCQTRYLLQGGALIPNS